MNFKYLRLQVMWRNPLHEVRKYHLNMIFTTTYDGVLILWKGLSVKIIPKDINIWISRLFLGDADGFSILYYQDVDSLVYWINQADIVGS